MLFNLFDKQFDISPLCVFIFYDTVTSFIHQLKENEEKGALEQRYPGYSFCILKRHDDYMDSNLMDLSEHTLISRVIPQNGEKDVHKFYATTQRENLKVDLEFFEFFMEELMKENTERALTYHSTLNNISEFVRQNLPHLYQSTDDIIDQMTSLFQSKIERIIAEAQSVKLKLDYNQKTGKWLPVLMVDRKKYKIPIESKKSLNAIFVYFLLHPKTKISGQDLENDIFEGELSNLITTLYPNANSRNIILDFKGQSLSSNVGKMRRMIAEKENSMAVAPFLWILKKNVPNGTREYGEWTFVPPEKVEIDVEKFRDYMLNITSDNWGSEIVIL